MSYSWVCPACRAVNATARFPRFGELKAGVCSGCASVSEVTGDGAAWMVGPLDELAQRRLIRGLPALARYRRQVLDRLAVAAR